MLIFWLNFHFRYQMLIAKLLAKHVCVPQLIKSSCTEQTCSYNAGMGTESHIWLSSFLLHNKKTFVLRVPWRRGGIHIGLSMDSKNIYLSIYMYVFMYVID